MKKRVKAKRARIGKQRNGTGGGKPSKTQLDTFELSISALISNVEVVGDAAINESYAPFVGQEREQGQEENGDKEEEGNVEQEDEPEQPEDDDDDDIYFDANLFNEDTSEQNANISNVTMLDDYYYYTKITLLNF